MTPGRRPFDARAHAGRPAHREPDPRACPSVPSAAADRDEDEGRHRTRDVRGIRRTGGASGERAAFPRCRAGRSGRVLRLQQRPAPRALLRRALHGLDPPHAEHPSPSRSDRLDRQSRRGQGRVRGRHAGAGLREGRPEPEDGRTHRGHGLGKPRLAGRRARLRGAPGRFVARRRLARARRAPGQRHVLHEWDHGQPEGCRVLASVDGPALVDDQPGLDHRPDRARRGPPGGPDVPRQRVGHAVRGRTGRREAGLPRGVQRRPGGAVRPDRRRARHGPGWCTDHLDRAAPVPGDESPRPVERPVYHGRRFGRAGVPDRALQAPGRRGDGDGA